MCSYVILVVLALAASSVSPALSAPTRHRYGSAVNVFHRAWFGNNRVSPGAIPQTLRLTMIPNPDPNTNTIAPLIPLPFFLDFDRDATVSNVGSTHTHSRAQLSIRQVSEIYARRMPAMQARVRHPNPISHFAAHAEDSRTRELLPHSQVALGIPLFSTWGLFNHAWFGVRTASYIAVQGLW